MFTYGVNGGVLQHIAGTLLASTKIYSYEYTVYSTKIPIHVSHLHHDTPASQLDHSNANRSLQSIAELKVPSIFLSHLHPEPASAERESTA